MGAVSGASSGRRCFAMVAGLRVTSAPRMMARRSCRHSAPPASFSTQQPFLTTYHFHLSDAPQMSLPSTSRQTRHKSAKKCQALSYTVLHSMKQDCDQEMQLLCQFMKAEMLYAALGKFTVGCQQREEKKLKKKVGEAATGTTHVPLLRRM
jgi:hypothetical protein